MTPTISGYYEDPSYSPIQGPEVKPRGKQGRSKLNASDVVAIRALAATMTYVDIAARYNMSPAAIRQIVERITWREIQ